MGKRISFRLVLICFLLTITACAAQAGGSEQGSQAKPSSQEAGFADVPADAWYAEAVQYCRENGLMAGTSDTTFVPEAPLTRAMLIAILWRQEGKPAVNYLTQFSDVPTGQWYSEAVCWAAGEKLIAGYGDGRFGANDPITQEQMSLIFQRYTGQPVTKDIPGFDGSSKNATRAQAAAAVMNCAQLLQQGTVGGKVLVAYFSATGNTRPVAEAVAEATGGDLFEIVPAQPYTAADLNYNTGCRANAEQNDPDARPSIANAVEDMEQYDVVLISFPIWWGRAPKIIHTFLETYDLSGKTIATFCTSGGSGHEDATLRSYEPNAAWLEGRRFSGTSQVNDWVSSLDLPKTADGEANKMYIQSGNTVWTVALENNPSVTAWKELLSKGPLTVDMSDYGGFEKAGSIGATLTQTNRQITARPRDIILYQGSSVSIYYGENTWNFTRLGQVDSVTESELRAVLQAGGGNISVTFSIDEPIGGSGARAFDFETKTVTLSSGYEMPINGLGTYNLHGESCVNSVKSALASGVRLIDTASAYGNEEEVGQAIREAMEAFVEDGKIRSLGLSNWYVEELEEFLPQVTIPPALVQNEIHPYYQENDVIPYIQGLGIVVQGWYPLGGRGHTAELLGDEVISGIAHAHGVSSAQVILRWNLQKGVVVIPGSSNPEHIKENTELYDFTLNDAEMEQINALDRNEKHDWY
ncbi:flavodoxin [Pseudoflavonifractor sp. 524-17]|uniref:flavodoxin n=1 Tax=Pseudoflavonifractor sp. 524-17 TaxID=2304577 RepID=UPI001FAE47AC|nr:flavodoxin [Pseudoflavonifractor sp. 524-17]